MGVSTQQMTELTIWVPGKTKNEMSVVSEEEEEHDEHEQALAISETL